MKLRTQVWNFIKIPPVGAELFDADGQKDIKLIVFFLNFWNAPKNEWFVYKYNETWKKGWLYEAQFRWKLCIPVWCFVKTKQNDGGDNRSQTPNPRTYYNFPWRSSKVTPLRLALLYSKMV